jgi:hypothetical protein
MEGSCACKTITFRAGEPLQFVNCHCNLCRKINGSAFSSYVVAKADAVDFSGSEELQCYTATDCSTKHFCSKCGTPIYNSNPITYPGLVMLYLGTLANAQELKPGINIFCSSKLDWVDGLASQPSYPESPQSGT